MDNDINREINIEQVEFDIDIDNIEYSIEINPRDTFAVELNEQGPQGARGYTGNGIESYELTSTVGLTDTYTITFTDGNTTTVDVTNGRGITSITGPVSVGNIDTYTINYNDNTTSTFTVTNGIDGINPTVTVGTTTTGNPGTNASVVNTGTTQDVVLDFTIPRGDKGDTGAAATITVGTVTTGLPTDPASVTNVGTSGAAIFDFTIPKGDTGDTGPTGNGVVNTEYISSSGLVDTYHINYTNGNYDSFTVTNGRDGSGAVTDVTVNGTSVLDDSVAKVLVPTDNSQLTNGANYITASALNGYATETWVGNQGYITGITSLDVTTALGYTPLSNSTKYGSSLSYSSNVLQLLDQDGNILGSSVTIQSSPDIDNKSITTNLSDELQTVGVIDQNNTSTAIKTWTGTKAQYDAIVTKDANTLYNITDDTDVTLSLLELIYPVGSIYIGTMATCPLATLGVGTWQFVAANRVLQGVGENQDAGDTLEQEVKLPNITGSFCQSHTTYNQGTVDTGAFYNINAVGHNMNTGNAGTTHRLTGFSASRCSTVYSGDGTDTKIQQPAYLVNIWERIN